MKHLTSGAPIPAAALAAMLLLLAFHASAQDREGVPADTLSQARDSLTAIAGTAAAADDSVSAAASERPDSTVRSAAETSARLTAGNWTLSRDSVALMEYHHLGEIALRHPQMQLSHLGNYGQPAWLSLAGAQPWQSSVTVDGILDDRLPTSQPDLYRFATEDVERYTVRPQYQAFWYGAPGDVTVVEVEKKIWNAPRPITRLRHTEAANEYLYTDGMFTLNPSEGSNLFLALARTGIGSTSSNNAARYPNNRHESWNARAAYRQRAGDILTLTGRLQYDEHLTLLNGGVGGTFMPGASTPYFYASEATGSFADSAFDPKAADALLVNPTMYTEGQHYRAEVGALLQWDDDSTQVSHLRLSVDSDVRRYRDNLAAQYPGDSLAEPRLNLTDHWTLAQAVLDHATQLGWAELDLQGAFGSYGLVMGGEALDDADVMAHARGRLSLFLGPVALSGFARLDQRFGSSTLSFGAGGEIPLGPLTAWGGASYAARPRSPLEREYLTSRVAVSGDRTPDLDKIAVAEGGLRLATDWLTMDLRGFVRNETRYGILRALAYSDTVLGRSALVYTEYPDGRAQTFYGGSADARFRLWRLHLDVRASVLRADVGSDDLPAPELSAASELYYRGGLIEGTLDLRAGARLTYATQFMPGAYHPETGAFLEDALMQTSLRSYTDVQRVDLFIYATIKQRATIHVVLYNLLDDRHITSAFYPMFDRAFRLGVDWVFFD